MKISIIGAGNVGATCAQRILEADLADIVLVDIADSMAHGKAEDMMDAASLIGHSKTIIGTGDYAATQDSDIAVITAGLARKPGMTREQLLIKNAEIVRHVAENIVRFSKHPIIIVVTNPLDVMTLLVLKTSQLKTSRVFGMAGALDSSRMNLMIARSLGMRVNSAKAVVLGTHGQTMVPAISQSKVDKRMLSEIMDCDSCDKITEKTKQRGAEIVAALGSGSAYYAPSAGVFKMVSAIVNNTHEQIPVSCYLDGEYGIRDVCLGVPVKIGNGGIERILQLDLTTEEQAQLKAAAEAVQIQFQSLKI